MKSSQNKTVGSYVRRLLLFIQGIIALEVIGFFTIAHQRASNLPIPSMSDANDALNRNTESFLHSWNTLTKNYNTSESSFPNESVLIIGGSDGSGTRAFVDLVHRHFRIPFVLDDVRSFDVHGKVMFRSQGDYGWPPLVRSILKETHSGNYNLTSLSDSARLTAIGELNKLKSYLFHMIKRRKERSGVSSPAPSLIQFGFKAPVSMLLLPLLKEVFGSVRFLHVVRDGRDVSLSNNQSPVAKFYEIYYGRKSNAVNTSHVQSMELWNDWNTQVLRWEQDNSDGVTFQHLVLRTEDLVQNSESRLNLLLQLGSFLNVYPSIDNLCKIWKEELHDLGVSVAASAGGETRHRRRGMPIRDAINLVDLAMLQKKRAETEVQRSLLREKMRLEKNFSRRLLDKAPMENAPRHVQRIPLHQRYGKWQELQQVNPDLLLQLEGTGAVGLEAFGYKPTKALLDAHPLLPSVLQECTASTS